MPPKKNKPITKKHDIDTDNSDTDNSDESKNPPQSLLNGFYDIITSKEFIDFNKDFAKNLIAAFIYKTIYDTLNPSTSTVMAPQPEPEPIRRGIVVRGREVKPPSDESFTEIVFRDRPAQYPSSFGEQDFGVTPESITIPFGSKDIGKGFSDDLKHIGKEAFKSLLLAGIAGAAGAVGSYNIGSKNDIKNTKPYVVPIKNSPYNLEERAKNWAAEVKNKKQMHDILSEFDDISDINNGDSGLSHFSSKSYGLGLKNHQKLKGANPLEKGEIIPLVSKINDKIKEGIEYIYENATNKKTIMTFLAVIFALGTTLIFANSRKLTDEAIDNIMNFSHILSDCVNGRVTLRNIIEYVKHQFPRVIHNTRWTYGGKLKTQKPQESDENPVIKETFYEKRIKPIAKKAYDIITSDESITIAKTLAQIAFLTLVMYGVREAGTAMYKTVTPSPESLRTAKQDLIELAEAEIACPTYYKQTRGCHSGRTKEYDKSQYPRFWPKDVGTNKPNEDVSKVNRILAKATNDSGYMGKAQTEELINTLKQISEHDKNVYDAKVKQAVRDVTARKITPEESLKIMRDKPTHSHIKNLMLKNENLRELNPKVWKPSQKKFVTKKPNPFVIEFRQHIPTLEEHLQWRKGQMLSGKGLQSSDDYEMSAELKKIAKKIYDSITSKYGKNIIKGLTVATILAGLTAFINSQVNPTMSPEELKEQYLNKIGEEVLF